MSDAMERLRSRQSGTNRSYNPLDALTPATPAAGDIVYLPADKLHDFFGHTFKQRPDDDPYVLSLYESIKDNGVLEPLLIRPHPSITGEYEVIAGHTRKRIGLRTGMTKLPCLIQLLDDDEAIVRMGESNIQRPDWLPSERAATYKAHLEAVGRQYQRKAGRHKAGQEQNLGTGFPNLDGERLRDLAAQKWGVSGKTLELYIKLTELVPELMDMVDSGRIAIKGGYQLSFLPAVEQQRLLTLLLNYPKCKVNESKAKDIRTLESSTWPRILRIDRRAASHSAPVWKAPIPRTLLSAKARSYLDDPELQNRLAQVINRYVSEKDGA